MKVEKLALKNFRNIADCEFAPAPRLNFLLGSNGQGKTSFLEALGYLATLRSFRGSKSAEVIRWGCETAEVHCVLTSTDPAGPELGDWKTELKLVFQAFDPERKKISKTVYTNGKPSRSSTQYLSQRFGSYHLGFHTVVFNPSDHDLVRGEPSIRRAYLDRVLAAEKVEYLKDFSRYHRVLGQRNVILKTGDRSQRQLLLGFTEALTQLGAKLAFQRLEWFEKLAGRLNDAVSYIAPLQPELKAIYLSNWIPPIKNLSITNNNLGSGYFTGLGAFPSLELLEQEFWKKLSSLEEQEWRMGHSLVGPHRDDWTFFLDSQMLKGHGSQGEVRSALLALKLSEIELFQKETGHRPLFLLDDFSSELDRERRSFLLRFLMETDLQVFVTTTEDSNFAIDGFTEGQRFRVFGGSLRKEVSEKHDYANRQPEAG